MDIIYSASPLGAFTNSLIYIAIFFVLGIGNLALLLLTRKPRKKRKIGDIVFAVISLFLMFIAVLISVVTFNTYQNGNKTVDVRVLEKRETTVKCGQFYCTEYNVETSDGGKFYVFGLEKDVWEKVEENACYRFTYYPLRPLLADYLPQESSSYETTGYITLIEKVGC
jgi:hypothetical protein